MSEILKHSSVPPISDLIMVKKPRGYVGADIVLGMLPLAREMLKMGSEVVLCANSLPAINDITVQELKDLVDTVGKICPIIQVRSCSLPPSPSLGLVQLKRRHPTTFQTGSKSWMLRETNCRNLSQI